MRGPDWSDGKRIGALGTSAGSTAVRRCAIETRELVAGICVATYLGHFVTMPDGPAKLLVDHLDALVVGHTVEATGSGGSIVDHFGLPFFQDAIGGAPIYRLHDVGCPIFFLQGGADNVYRRADAWLGYEVLRSLDLPTAYREIPEGDHALGNVPLQATKAILEWLRAIGFLRHRANDPA